MCVVSAIINYWMENPLIYERSQDRLIQSIELLQPLLIAAKNYDKTMGEPDCEMKEKVDLLKKVAKDLKVDLHDIFE